ncbi:MAG: UPF0149 family protein [Gammaproteobacteria bacterium]|nr:UPF0149 family protein [Gammaproteobacteria bacterium]
MAKQPDNPRVGLDTDLSEQEINALDDFLASPGLEDTAMDVAMMEGFMAALVVGPGLVMPSEWLPWVWDIEDGQVSPRFETAEEAAEVTSLVMRHYNSLARQFMENAEDFEPLFYFDQAWGVAEWCAGFLLGTLFEEERWSELMESEPDWFAPFMLLGTDEGLEVVEKEGDGEHWVLAIVPALADIHAYWLARRSGGAGRQPTRKPFVRDATVPDRNDPCPCGSGKKYKKCCGDGGAVLH